MAGWVRRIRQLPIDRVRFGTREGKRGRPPLQHLPARFDDWSKAATSSPNPVDIGGPRSETVNHNSPRSTSRSVKTAFRLTAPTLPIGEPVNAQRVEPACLPIEPCYLMMTVKRSIAISL